MSREDLQENFETATACARSNPPRATELLKGVVASAFSDDESVSLKERAIYELASIYCNTSAKAEILSMVDSEPLSGFFAGISKAKCGKIVRTLIEKLTQLLESDKQTAIEMCTACIDWCVAQKRKFLKLQIETKLCVLYLDTTQLQMALKKTNKLVSAVKKLDDKHVLVEVHLIESRVQHALHNIPKAKAALTAARAAANSIYIGPQIQAEMDMQSGRLGSEERDYKTAFSYFYEAFEAYDTLERGEKPEARARLALKYMLLSKIMNELSTEVEPLCLHKLAVKYAGDLEIECMKAVAKAYSKRSLHDYETVINDERYATVIHSDKVVKSKLTELSDKLIEQNLSKLIEPFSRVEVAHIAQLIDLDVAVVSRKLSQMILDDKFNGILDQGTGAVIVFEDQTKDKSYDYALETIESLGHTVDKLFEKAKLLD